MDHVLETADELPLPLERVFDFFSDATNLERITPSILHFKITSPQPIRIERGAMIDYRLRLFGISFSWRSEITEWNPPHSFIDEQRRGPYALWVHRHTFVATAGGTKVSDHVRYRLPLSPLGEIALPFVAWQLRQIFAFRQSAVRRILLPNSAETSGPPAAIN